MDVYSHYQKWQYHFGLTARSEERRMGDYGYHFGDERCTINMVPIDASVKNHGGPTAKVILEITSLRKIGSRTVL